jgi:hypothetical protein
LTGPSATGHARGPAGRSSPILYRWMHGNWISFRPAPQKCRSAAAAPESPEFRIQAPAGPRSTRVQIGRPGGRVHACVAMICPGVRGDAFSALPNHAHAFTPGWSPSFTRGAGLHAAQARTDMSLAAFPSARGKRDPSSLWPAHEFQSSQSSCQGATNLSIVSA